MLVLITEESIELFLENFDIKKIISFEASPKNFETLKSRYRNLSKTFFWNRYCNRKLSYWK